MRVSPLRLITFFLMAPIASAADLDWPSAACAGTLQACIDAAASGDTIQIRTEAEIQESPSIGNKSISLFKRGSAALFGAGRGAQVTAAQNGVNVTLRNLWFRNTVTVNVGSTTAAHTQNVTLTGVRVESSSALNGVIANQQAGATSAYTLTLERSKIELRAPGSTGLLINHTQPIGTPVVRVQNNEILSGLNGVDLRLSGNGGDTFVQGNRIGRPIRFPTSGGTGSFGIAAQGFADGASAHDVFVQRNVVLNFGFGIGLFGSNGRLNTQVVNNSVLNSSAHGITASASASNPLTGRIANNLVHRAGNCGLLYTTPSDISATANFNLYSGASEAYCSVTPGANDVIADARILGAFNARLRSGSPAINVGSNADQPAVPIIVAIPAPDHDGRAGRTDAQVDIGAFEFSFETSFVHTSNTNNITDNFTRVAAPFALLSSDRLQISQFGRAIDGISSLPSGSQNHLGVWFNPSTSLWTIFGQNTATGSIAPDRRFFTLLNINSNTNLLHISTAGNTTFNVTQLDHPLLNNQPDALPIVTQRWDPDLDNSGTYNNSSVGVWYNPAINRWTIFNQQPVGGPAPAMPENAAFHVMIANGLFAVGSHAYKTDPLGVSVALLNLDHPLLNNNECTHPYVTASYNPNSVYVPANLLVSYNPASNGRGNWAIERGDGQPIPAGASFHVYIDPQVARACSEDALMIDGFEN
jgi:hypothetical protein